MMEGAFYAWFDVTSTGMGSQDFLTKLKEEQNVALSPGDRFGADGFIRVPLIRPVPILKDVVGRLKEFKDGL
jgi:aspartate/methionine/tyrosine aminotransferase